MAGKTRKASAASLAPAASLPAGSAPPDPSDISPTSSGLSSPSLTPSQADIEAALSSSLTVPPTSVPAIVVTAPPSPALGDRRSRLPTSPPSALTAPAPALKHLKPSAPRRGKSPSPAPSSPPAAAAPQPAPSASQIAPFSSPKSYAQVAASPPSPHLSRPRRLYSEEDLTALSTCAAEAAVARFTQSISTGSGLLGPAFSQGPTFAHLPSPGEFSLLSSSCLLGPSPFSPSLPFPLFLGGHLGALHVFLAPFLGPSLWFWSGGHIGCPFARWGRSQSVVFLLLPARPLVTCGLALWVLFGACPVWVFWCRPLVHLGRAGSLFHLVASPSPKLWFLALTLSSPLVDIAGPFSLAPSRGPRPVLLHRAPVRGALLDPGAIKHHQRHIDIMQNGWQSYFPLYELCRSWSDTPKIPEAESRVRERSLSFMEFSEASQNLVSLIASHLASPDRALIARSWRSHYDIIFSRHDIYSVFELYLVYDEALRVAFPKRSQDFDPGEFQSHVWQSIIDTRRNDEMSEYRSLLGHLKITTTAVAASSLATPSTAPVATPSLSIPPPPPSASSSFRKEPASSSAAQPAAPTAPRKKAHCWFCGAFHRPKDCTSVGNGWLVKNADGDWKGPGDLS
ncbi:hypothetical protein P692DRAFT_20882682, partial [Suillus brevipes Sb2]